MGANYYAAAVIGVRIPYDKLFTKERVKAFDHAFPEDWVVDPKTGRKLWETDMVPVYEKAGIIDRETFDRIQRRGQASTHKAVIYFDGSSEGHEAGYVSRLATSMVAAEGRIKTTSEIFRSLSGVNLDTEFAALHEILEPIGLWNERAFGLWVVHYVSC